MIRFDHFNFNVLDLERSLAFYKKALGLNPVREIEAPDGAFKIVFLKNEENDFKLELTWLRDRETPYDLGDLGIIWPLSPTSMRRFTPAIRRWGASALTTQRWAFISSRIRTAIGLRLCRSGSELLDRKPFRGLHKKQLA